MSSNPSVKSIRPIPQPSRRPAVMTAQPRFAVVSDALDDLLAHHGAVTFLMCSAAPSNFTLKLTNRRRRAQG